MILRYRKFTDDFVTHCFVEPDYNLLPDGAQKITELCDIGQDTYIHVPDDLVIPEQPDAIRDSIESITLTAELKEEIKALSPHIRLSYQRLQDRIRSRYSVDDEQYFTRIMIGSLSGSYVMQEDEPGLIAAYQSWVEEYREVARIERASIGL